MAFLAVKKKRSRTGRASFGWELGRGYVSHDILIKFDCWCVVDDNGKLWCDAPSKTKADEIARRLNG